MSDEKLDAVIDKFNKNKVSQDLIEILMGRSPVLIALDKGYVYAVCRLTVDLKDQETILPDIEGHSLDF